MKALYFHRDDPAIVFKLFYDEDPSIVLAQYKVIVKKSIENDFKVKIRIMINPDGLLEFESANLIENLVIDPLDPVSYG